MLTSYGIMDSMSDNVKSALLVVDVQNDFCAGGALEVRDGDHVVAPLNRMIARAVARSEPIYATRDWHPTRTRHFQTDGGTWPPHCIQGTLGARFHPDLELPADVHVVTTGDDFDTDGYSGFDGHTPDGKTLLENLRERGITHLYVGGLATDYCVRQSVLDALKAGLRVSLLTDAVAAVNLQPGDGANAISEMERAGAVLVATESLENRTED
jgi:nicotinamidase/pyrazinamidase